MLVQLSENVFLQDIGIIAIAISERGCCVTYRGGDEKVVSEKEGKVLAKHLASLNRIIVSEEQ